MSYSLMHGPTLRREAPYTFFLPHPSYVDAVRTGDLVKLGFEYDPPTKKYGGERMWVEVEEIDGDRYSGRLVSHPDEPELTFEEQVQFCRYHILDVMLVDEQRLPEYHDDAGRYPVVERPQSYWERCLVDDCVLYEGVPVEYVYREEPEESDDDKYPDSGWRIRGMQGACSDEEMENREASFVALGAVLNRDDSWMHLIDSPIGSAFMRDFDSNTYEAVE